MILHFPQKKLSLRHILILSTILVVVAVSVGFLANTTKKDVNALFAPWQTNVLQIASNDTNKCLLTTDHRVFCWGRNNLGELGSGVNSNSDHPRLVRDDNNVFDGKIITNIYATGNGYCALASGSLFCWGDNSHHQFGDGSAVGSSSIPVAVDMTGVLAGKTITSVASSNESKNTCVIASGAPYCWGENDYKQLGDGSAVASSSVPVAVDMTGVLAGKTITSITVGFTSCVIASGAPYCWGSDINGMLGDGNDSGSASAVPVALDTTNVLAGKTVTTLAVFNGYGCLIASGTLYCWGQEDGTGRIGTGSATMTTQTLTPVDTSGALSGKYIDDVKVMQGYACASSGGSLYCWGNSGSSGTVVNSLSPVQISGTLAGHHVDAFSLEDSNACATASGVVSCWGDNTHGELGNNSTTSSTVPVAIDISGVPGGNTVSSMNLVSSSPCVIAASQPYCWGDNTFGNVGDGTTTNVLVPTALVLQALEVTSFSPSSVYTGIDTTRGFTITGSGFIDSTSLVVTIDGQVVTVFGSDTNIGGTVPSSSTPGPVDVTITNREGQTLTLHDALTYITPPPQAITSATFAESGGEKILTIHGTDLLKSATQFSDGLARSLVSVNGVALPFCSEGTPFTAQDLIGGFGVDPTLVSDTPPCYYLFDSAISPLINSTTAAVRVADTFDITSEGTVSIDGSPAYTFNAPVDTGGSGGGTPPPSTGGDTPPSPPSSSQVVDTTDTTVTPDETPVIIAVGDKSISDNPTISTLPTFTGFAPAGSKVTIVVHSDPITCSTTADESGKWSCTLTEKLPAGSHQVYVTVVTPENKTIELGPYSVTVSDEQPVTVTSDMPTASTKQSNFPWIWVVAGGILLIVVVLIIIGVNRRKRA